MEESSFFEPFSLLIYAKQSLISHNKNVRSIPINSRIHKIQLYNREYLKYLTNNVPRIKQA